jgi:O-antigen/teichoic acid export membrane protein
VGFAATIVVARLLGPSDRGLLALVQLLGTFRFGLLNLLLVPSRAVSLASIVLFVGLVDLGVPGALAASIAAALFMIVSSLAVVLLEVRPVLDWALFRRMLLYCARVVTGSIFGLATYRVDLLVLQFYAPLSEVGYYVGGTARRGTGDSWPARRSWSATSVAAPAPDYRRSSVAPRWS